VTPPPDALRITCKAWSAISATTGAGLDVSMSGQSVPQYQDVELKEKADVALACEEGHAWAREVAFAAPHFRRVDRQLADEGKLSPMERFQLEARM